MSLVWLSKPESLTIASDWMWFVPSGVPATAALVHALSGKFSSRLVKQIEKLDDWLAQDAHCAASYNLFIAVRYCEERQRVRGDMDGTFAPPFGQRGNSRKWRVGALCRAFWEADCVGDRHHSFKHRFALPSECLTVKKSNDMQKQSKTAHCCKVDLTFGNASPTSASCSEPAQAASC